MRTCARCGLAIGDTATFCPVCGAKVMAAPGVTAARDAAAPPPSAAQAPGTSPPRGPATRPGSTTGAPATPSLACALCDHPGPLVAIEGVRLCRRCHARLELLVDRDAPIGRSVPDIAGDDSRRRTAARIVGITYKAHRDADTCYPCIAMDGRETSNIAEAAAWTPNPSCVSPAGCRCHTVPETASLRADEVRDFLDYAVANRLPVNALVVAQFHAGSGA